MALRPRTRLQLRRTVVAAALGALFVPAVADAKAKTPVITKVTPTTASVGTKITITGKNFRRGKAKNSVLFRRDKGKALFVKADVSTTKKLTVVVPKTLEKYMLVNGTTPIPTRFKLRVLAAKLSKAYTTSKLSPVIGPEKLNPSTGTGTGTGTAAPVVDPNGDLDNDGLTNSFETGVVKTDPNTADSDGDGITDGYEYGSAVDLNSDDYRFPAISLPYPGKRPYPNPLDPSDLGTDYDGDGLDLYEEYALWCLTVRNGANPSLQALTYSDGLKYSVYTRTANGRRVGTLVAATYDKQANFLAWLDESGYSQVRWPDAPDTPFHLLDVNRNGIVDAGARVNYVHSEIGYLDSHGTTWASGPDGILSDDERDEDADGLSNWIETHGPMLKTWFKSRYTRETPFPILYEGTELDDDDSDGDGVRDGADDQDHDDVPNIAELSRNMVTGRGEDDKDLSAADATTQNKDAQPEGRVNPYNPCLPFIEGRTCPTYIPFSGVWAPFDGPPFDMDGSDPNYLVLN
jgi:hypothetical protein